jgi:hypothetical protein
MGFTLLVIILTALVSGVSAGCDGKNKLSTGENNMTITHPKIPVIDTLIPDKTETATFALG